jgi:hypothetical protein
MTELAAGLLLGLAASAHCVVMCGPLVVALHRPVVRAHGGAFGVTSVYHGARIAAYAVLGIVAGLAGQAIALAGLGRLVSVVAGLTLLAFAAHALGARLGARTTGLSAAGVYLGRVLGAMSRRGQGHPLATAAGAGMLNAVLPCGLLYGALAAAAALGDAVRAASFMALYGAGTLPLLAAVSLWPVRAAAVQRGHLAWGRAAVLVAVGLLLIGRGLLPVVDRAVAAAHGH